PHEDPSPEGSPSGAREADHHRGAPGLQLGPPGDRPGARHRPHHALQKMKRNELILYIIIYYTCYFVRPPPSGRWRSMYPFTSRGRRSIGCRQTASVLRTCVGPTTPTHLLGLPLAVWRLDRL